MGKILNIEAASAVLTQPLLTPQQLQQQLPLVADLAQQVDMQRATIKRILQGQDRRLLVITGPCSIHDPASALEYAAKLKGLAEQLQDKLYLVMRVYVEKPRTELGWQGYLLDPALDGSVHANEGLIATRRLMRSIVAMGVPVATEYLSPVTERYVGDLVSWAAIGARSAESQLHRNFISGLTLPVGCKNPTSGLLDAAIATLKVGMHPQQFFGVNTQGQLSLIKTQGNPACHLVLRGGATGPNYDELSLARAQEKLRQKELQELGLVVDCSHGNSGKDYRRQSAVAIAVANSFRKQSLGVRGLMLESHLVAGKQSMCEPLVYGQSITDACLGWEETAATLHQIADSLEV